MTLTTEQALINCIKAWEALPKGAYRPSEVQAWMKNHLKPAFDEARKTLNFPIPSGLNDSQSSD